MAILGNLVADLNNNHQPRAVSIAWYFNAIEPEVLTILATINSLPMDL